jgi:hypothetical protein
MQKLFWKTKHGKVIAAIEVPFKTEEEFERYVQTTKEILSDIFILKRQVRAGRDIPDMVGIDQENYAVIIENKNQPVDEGILPQIVRYAVWAETHQDAIKAWWYEAKDRSDDIGDIDIKWDRLQIRVIVLAPSIKPTVPRLVKKLGYPVELIEIKKFVVGHDEIILVNQLETPDEEGRGPTRGMQDYDRQFYEQNHNPRSVDAFFDMVTGFEKIVKNKGWNLKPKFNAYYAGFKYQGGFFNVFGVTWVGNKSLGVFVKIPKDKVARAKKLCPYPSEYDQRWKDLNIRVTDNFKPKRLVPLLQFAYDLLVGQHRAE